MDVGEGQPLGKTHPHRLPRRTCSALLRLCGVAWARPTVSDTVTRSLLRARPTRRGARRPAGPVRPCLRRASCRQGPVGAGWARGQGEDGSQVIEE